MDISARAVSLADRPRLGHLGHQCSHAPGRPNLHLYLSSRRPRQVRVIDLAMSSRIPHLTFSYSTIKQVGRWRSTSPRSPDHEPGFKPVALPALRLDQHNPRRLHEQNPQVAVAALGYLAQDCAVSG